MFLVPVSVTVANFTGSPGMSLTCPEITLDWAEASKPLSISTAKKARNLLMCILLVNEK
jgi:hypothetical protein